jgi:hypothetical protein
MAARTLAAAEDAFTEFVARVFAWTWPRTESASRESSVREDMRFLWMPRAMAAH